MTDHFPQEPPYDWPPAPPAAPPMAPPPSWPPPPPPFGFEPEPERKPSTSRIALATLVVLAMLAGAFGAIIGASIAGVDPLSTSAARRAPAATRSESGSGGNTLVQTVDK